MQNQPSPILFDQNVAAAYDEKTALWAAGRDALFSLIRLILADLSSEAQILCVGVGTGTEMIALAQAFPHCRFTAVEPAPAMLDICRQKAAEHGIASRCTFHAGYLDSLPTSAPFDAATCLLVSQFFKEAADRSHFFSQIAHRLRPGGILINSDLVLGLAPPVHQSLFEVWLRMLGGSGWSEADIEKTRAAWQLHMAALTPPDIEAIIVAGGFTTPVLFFQTLFIHAWFATRTALD
ncbi:class I SAM-dependent methyltransferase [Nodosilinea sp. PGN35]|uniref:class I SAM-dependent methyltransferase n=1 Tax=Nodosilinea sp. PGN35 TaxID=3020489 RepID=UPI0023B2C78F|nr:class I SAM-dependent methyltransferase [Nodosilinea sp. TSF1-S3]MDF0367919.1 methyltransferase domain-containing protein [Nodosilinea sp. TSF1-S3]